ncbi:MAG TPA: alpha/beta hydrolase [Dehalococcoidia bacterium]|jgi:pimeloyl-ACP methyl ester carboxylesterase
MVKVVDTPGLTHHYATINGIRMHWVEQGSGPLVVLLHGFPEFWYSWRHQLSALAGAGYRVVAPDQRGYNLTEKPRGVAAYAMDNLVEDVAALIRHLGEERAAIVGHDWGGGVAWMFAMLRPGLTRRLVVMNCPHPAAMQRALRRNPRQMLRSWYILFFQLPKLPELAFRARNYRAIERAFRGWALRPGTFSDADIRAYKEAAAQPGALTAAINWYRAAAREFRRNRPLPVIEAPALLIWATKDRALGVELTRGLDRWVGDLRIRYVPRTSHWVQQEQPERVNRYLLEFLAEDERSL